MKSGVDLTTGRNQSMGVIPKPNGYIGFTKIDLTGIKKLDLTVAGRRPRRRWRLASTIEVRAGSPTGELLGQLTTRHQPRRQAADAAGGAGAAQAAASTATGSGGTGGRGSRRWPWRARWRRRGRHCGRTWFSTGDRTRG